MSDNKRFQKWTIFSHAKLRLSGEPWDKTNPKERPSLMYKVVNNNPRFLLYMNDGKNNNGIPFALDAQIAFQLFTMVEMAVADKDPSRYSLELKGSFVNGQRQDKPVVVGRIHVGRDTEGVVFIAFQGKGLEAAKFVFRANYFASIHNAEGELLEQRKCSEIVATAWADLMRGLTTSYMVVHGKEPENKPGSGGGYSGGGNSGGGKRSGGNDWDSDVEF